MNYNINVVGRYNTTHVPPLSLIHTSLSFMFGIFQAYMARVKLDITTAELLRQRRLLIAQRRTPKSAVPKKKYIYPAPTPYRYRPGTVALREIRKFQKSTDLLINRSSLNRVIRQISDNKYRYQVTALLAIQVAAEAFLVQIFEEAELSAIHGKRVTVFPRDLALVKRIRGL